MEIFKQSSCWIAGLTRIPLVIQNMTELLGEYRILYL
jgi:uncharacterized membrane protein